MSWTSITSRLAALTENDKLCTWMSVRMVSVVTRISPPTLPPVKAPSADPRLLASASCSRPSFQANRSGPTRDAVIVMVSSCTWATAR